MEKILILIALLGFVTLNSYGQCTFTIGNEVYDITCFEKLTNSESPLNSLSTSLGIEVSFVNKNCGKVVFKGFTEDVTEFSDGTIYLDDQSSIKLIDRNKSWSVNMDTYKMYNLTCSEVERLKSNNVKLIRFSVSSRFRDNVYRQYYNSSYSYSDHDFEESFAERRNFPKMIREVFGY